MWLLVSGQLNMDILLRVHKIGSRYNNIHRHEAIATIIIKTLLTHETKKYQNLYNLIYKGYSAIKYNI